jgi:predicted RNase H-like HicB family nuclease
MVNRGGKKMGTKMKAKLRMVYWKSDKFWLGKLVDHPEIMTQGETLKELEENMIDAYKLMLLDEVPDEHEVKEIVLSV